jgi:(5-formylfuran-3-yl)methyl phosphate synthase
MTSEVVVLVPRLLISVRNAIEAAEAIRGLADVIDVKEPARGAMGLADCCVLDEVRRTVLASQTSVQFSVALGELADWRESDDNRASVRNWVSTLPSPPPSLKIGPAGLTASPGWRQSWPHTWRKLIEACAPNRPQPACADPASNWVAVAYADWQRAHAPAPEVILGLAAEIGCGTLLVDTFTKDATRLTDWLTVQQVQRLAGACTDAGLQFAVAGRVDKRVFPALKLIQPDIVGVRGAVCRGGNRAHAVSAERVRDLREQLCESCTDTPMANAG